MSRTPQEGHRPTEQVHPFEGAAGRNRLARAILTSCSDGPDALMHASLMGAPNAACLLAALEMESPRPCEWMTGWAGDDASLDAMFLKGAARWGRRTDSGDLGRFARAKQGWLSRLSVWERIQPEEAHRRLTEDGRWWIVAPGDGCWPGQLDDLAVRSDWAPPLCLWGSGEAAALNQDRHPIAVVGSRNCNDYGRSVAHSMGFKAARLGHIVISGGAMGADASAHWGALESGAGPETGNPGGTVAVFAGGLDRMGPRCNGRLFKAIREGGGALISEMPPGTVPEARRFLLRNRIIAALAGTVVVAQARSRSGAINTATWAAELGRMVYAAPGRIDMPDNAGCNRLIHEGRATLLMGAADLPPPALHGPAHCPGGCGPVGGG